MIPWEPERSRFFQNMASSSLTYAIIRTLCYSQIFSYPLTEAELWQYLLHNKKVSRKTFTRYLNQNLHIFEKIYDYYVLHGDSKLVAERTKRHGYSVKKLRKAVLISRILFYIPTVKLIGVSGSLSMYNAKKEDDIDLFFITSKNFLWTTRFMVNVVLYLFGQKRMKEEKYAQDKICPNMFMPEDALRIKKQDQNIYTAHEIVQMKVLFANDNMHLKFLSQNAWVLRHMPHAFTVLQGGNRKKKNSLDIFLNLLQPFEKLLYAAQYLYMKKRITGEKISKTEAFFHPSHHKKAILALYNLKIFYNMQIAKNAKRLSLTQSHKETSPRNSSKESKQIN